MLSRLWTSPPPTPDGFPNRSRSRSFIDTDILSAAAKPPRRMVPVPVVALLPLREEEEEPCLLPPLETGIGMGMGIDRRGGGGGDSESGPAPAGRLDMRGGRGWMAVGEGVLSRRVSASAGAMPRREAAAFSPRTEIL
jgi:hypothetical protein